MLGVLVLKFKLYIYIVDEQVEGVYIDNFLFYIFLSVKLVLMIWRVYQESGIIYSERVGKLMD